jgi:hypothetical protein
MLAPGVVSLIVTVCELVYVPAGGEKVGVAATERAVYVADPDDG